MYVASNSSREILLELNKKAIQHLPSNISLEQLEAWLQPLPLELNKETARVIKYRYCNVDTPTRRPTFPEIAQKIGLTLDQVRNRHMTGMRLLQTEPRFSAIEKSGLLVCRTQLYILLFGCDCMYCIDSYEI